MSILPCDSRHAALQADVLTRSAIGPAIIADSAAWVSEFTGGGQFAWSRRTYDGAASLMISDDGTLGDNESISFGVWLAPDDAHDYHEPRVEGYGVEAHSMPHALALAHAMEAGRAFAIGFRDPSHWHDSYAYSPDAAKRLAKAFADELTEWLGKDGIATVRRENAAMALSHPTCCASGDHCDSNMAMEAACRATFGAGPLDGPNDGMSETACNLWNEAWDIAKRVYLTATETESALCAEYEAWLIREGWIEAGCAVELLHELHGEDGDQSARIAWLSDFITRWDAMEAARKA